MSGQSDRLAQLRVHAEEPPHMALLVDVVDLIDALSMLDAARALMARLADALEEHQCDVPCGGVVNGVGCICTREAALIEQARAVQGTEACE